MTVSHPDLEWRETVRGAKPGDRYVRVATHKGFTRIRRGYLVPRPGTGQPTMERTTGPVCCTGLSRRASMLSSGPACKRYLLMADGTSLAPG
jgi:hypothetical protein